MGREQFIRYRCDWCGATSDPGPERHGSNMPKGWGYVDSTHEILCPECHVARNAAIAEAKRRRTEGIRL